MTLRQVEDIRVGDVIVINSQERLVNDLEIYKGGLVRIQFFRNGKPKTRTYQFGERVRVTS